jgi:thiol-disulfide isomerase/thioredoxin
MIEKQNLDPADYVNSVVYFGALSWCAPCKQLHPWMQKISGQYTGLQFIYVDVDTADLNLIKRHNIMSVPTVKLFINSEEKASVTGIKQVDDYARLEALFKEYTGE